jgi:predicted RNA-binding Zn ribbon-like protein
METGSVGLFEFNSGRLCLDFANTVRARPLSDRVEYINKYSELVSWARQATIITPGEAALLNEDAARRPRPAGEALSQALTVREAIHGLFSARAAGLPASAGDRPLDVARRARRRGSRIRMGLAGSEARSRPRDMVGGALGRRADDLARSTVRS